MEKKTIEVEVSNASPMLMNRFLDKSIDAKSKKRTGAQTEADIEEKLYLYDGKAHIPAVYFRNSIVEASKQFKITGKGKSTYSKLIGATVEVTPEMIPIEGGYEPFRIAAVNPMTKGRMMVTRPRFNKWSAKFKIVLHDESVPVEVMNEVLTQAGNYVGVGDWRPEKKGMFGKFIITKYNEVKS